MRVSNPQKINNKTNTHIYNIWRPGITDGHSHITPIGNNSDSNHIIIIIVVIIWRDCEAVPRTALKLPRIAFMSAAVITTPSSDMLSVHG